MASGRPSCPRSRRRVAKGETAPSRPATWAAARSSRPSSACPGPTRGAPTSPSCGRGRPSCPHDPLPVAPLGGAFLVVGLFLTALGPVVRRVRRLTVDVRRSAAGAYLHPVAVEGHDEIAELATAFNGAAAEVRAQIEAQEHREQVLRDFLANTTHDVAIPLTVLQGRATMRRAQVAGEPVPAELVSHAIEDAHHLGALIPRPRCRREARGR